MRKLTLSEGTPADRSAKSVVSDGGEYLIVQAIAEVTRRSVRIVARETGHEHLPRIRSVVPVRILKEKNVGCLSDDDAALHEHQARRQVQSAHEHRGLIGLAVPVRVFENEHAIRAQGAFGQHFVGIVIGLHCPHAPARIPREVDDAADHRIGCPGVHHEARLERRQFNGLLHRLRDRRLKDRLSHAARGGLVIDGQRGGQTRGLKSLARLDAL